LSIIFIILGIYYSQRQLVFFRDGYLDKKIELKKGNLILLEVDNKFLLKEIDSIDIEYKVYIKINNIKNEKVYLFKIF